MTWGVISYENELEVTAVGCYGRPRLDGSDDGPACDAYNGEMSCQMELPVLCLQVDGLARPNYGFNPNPSGSMPDAFYRGWAEGVIGLSNPVLGTELTSLSAANAVCVESLGAGYQMASHNDGKWIEGMGLGEYYGETWPQSSQLRNGGWNFWAYGIIEDETRFWVNIHDQPANCWDN